MDKFRTVIYSAALIVKLFIIAALIFLSQSCGPMEDEASAGSIYGMSCEVVSRSRVTFVRCSNEEAVCYSTSSGLSCNFSKGDL